MSVPITGAIKVEDVPNLAKIIRMLGKSEERERRMKAFHTSILDSVNDCGPTNNPKEIEQLVQELFNKLKFRSRPSDTWRYKDDRGNELGIEKVVGIMHVVILKSDKTKRCQPPRFRNNYGLLYKPSESRDAVVAYDIPECYEALDEDDK